MINKYMEVIVALIFILSIIILTISIQVNSIRNAAEFGGEGVTRFMDSSSVALQVWNSEESNSFGKFEGSEFSELTQECGSNSDIPAVSEGNLSVMRSGTYESGDCSIFEYTTSSSFGGIRRAILNRSVLTAVQTNTDSNGIISRPVVVK